MLLRWQLPLGWRALFGQTLALFRSIAALRYNLSSFVVNLRRADAKPSTKSLTNMLESIIREIKQSEKREKVKGKKVKKGKNQTF